MTKAYKPRRQSSKWLDGDCPVGVLCIFDNKGATADRYSVVLSDPICGTTYADMYFSVLDMSADPFSPQGIGMHNELQAHNLAAYRYRCKHHYAKWSSLPEDVKRCVRQDLS